MAQTPEERKAKARARSRAYQIANAEKIRLRKQAKRLANLEEARARDAAWRAAHPDIVRANNLKYRTLNRDKARAAARAWNEANSELVLQRAREWNAANPDRVTDIQRKARHKRRAMLLGNNSPGVTREEWAAIVDAYDGRCAYCPCPGVTVDHVIPIVRGGLDAPDNVVPACLSCNTSKKAKPLDEWLSSPAYARRLAKASG
jgi:5-methylcytosine-specific restriction endonuclease McrA